ncbi:hypothetical protein B0H10DRAFT_1952760 [Mycena sp. CBHHK59/15]|nr:hypothetical protein B0H10DRAFT_1952760 [Mycena sp. CBHHK59/15]
MPPPLEPFDTTYGPVNLSLALGCAREVDYEQSLFRLSRISELVWGPPLADSQQHFRDLPPDQLAQRVREVNVATAALMEGIPLSWLPPYSPGSSSSLPSYPLSLPVTSSSRPSPTKSDGCVKPYFTRTQAEEWANFNRQFTTGLHDKQFSGKFKVYPERHPAWKSGLEDAPVIMVFFHPETPGSRLPPMGFMTTLFEGYHEHHRWGVCTNTTDLYAIAELYLELEGLYDMATQMYPEGTPLPNHSDHINSMVAVLGLIVLTVILFGLLRLTGHTKMTTICVETLARDQYDSGQNFMSSRNFDQNSSRFEIWKKHRWLIGSKHPPAPLCWWDVFLAGLGIARWDERAIDVTSGAALPPGTTGPRPKARNPCEEK